MRKWLLVLVMAALGLPVVSFAQTVAPVAQEANAEEMLFMEIPSVSSSGFFATKKNLAPGSIFVVDQTMLTEYPVRTMQNVWDTFIPGVAAGAEHVHLGPHFDVRGAQSPITSTTLYMMNGNSFTDRLFTGYQWGQYSPLLGDIDRMEVTLGPGSLMHGSGAMDGFVNVIQKNGTDYSGVTANVEYGNPNNLVMSQVNYGKNLGEGKDLYVYGGYVQAPGSEYKDDFGNWFDGSAGRIEYDEVVNQKVQKITPSYRLSTNYRDNAFKFSGFIQDFHSSTDSPCTDDTPAGLRHDTVVLLAPEYTFNLSDANSIQVIPSYVMHDTIRERWVAPTATLNFANPSATGSTEDASATSEMYRGKAIFRTTAFEKQKIAAGLDYSYSNFSLGESLMDDSATTAYEGLPGDWTESSVFAEDVIAITEQLQASLGFRYDQVAYGSFSISGMDFTPLDQHNPSYRVAAAYSLNKDNSIKFSAQQGFAYATPGQLQWWGECEALSLAAGYGHIPAIKASSETSYELNYHTDLRELKLAADWNLYYNIMTDWINWSDGATQLTNQAQIDYLRTHSRLAGQHWINFPKTKNVGTEIMLKYAPANQVLLGLGYAYSQPTQKVTLSMGGVTESKKVYADYPTHQIKANMKLKPVDKLIFTTDVIVENSASLDFSFGAPGSSSQETGFKNPRFRLNLLLDYAITANWSASLMGMNVTENKNMAKAMGKGYLNRNQRYTYLVAKYKM